MKTYKSVEELKGKPQGPDSLRRNGSGKKVCFPGGEKQVCLKRKNGPFLKVEGTRGASVTSPDEALTKNGAKLRRGSSGRSAGNIFRFRGRDLLLKLFLGFLFHALATIEV